MAMVICDVSDCKHRSRRKLRKWNRQSGIPCYGCTLKVITVRPVFDPDCEIEAVGGKENTVVCSQYEWEG